MLQLTKSRSHDQKALATFAKRGTTKLNLPAYTENGSALSPRSSVPL